MNMKKRKAFQLDERTTNDLERLANDFDQSDTKTIKDAINLLKAYTEKLEKGYKLIYFNPENKKSQVEVVLLGYDL